MIDKDMFSKHKHTIIRKIDECESYNSQYKLNLTTAINKLGVGYTMEETLEFLTITRDFIEKEIAENKNKSTTNVGFDLS